MQFQKAAGQYRVADNRRENLAPEELHPVPLSPETLSPAVGTVVANAAVCFNHQYRFHPRQLPLFLRIPIGFDL